ncbi:MAG: hypothetical protein WCE80_03015, partial [Acidimicrobiia bacterium]
ALTWGVLQLALPPESARLGEGSVSRAAPAPVEAGIGLDPVLVLADLHRELWQKPGGGAVVSVSFDSEFDSLTPPTEAQVREYLWAAGTTSKAESVRLSWPSGISDAAAPPASTVLIVDGDGLVRGMAFFDKDGAKIDLEAQSELGDFLGLAAQQLYEEGYDRAPRGICEAPPPMARSALDALHRYFELFAETPELEMRDVWIQARLTADRIADESAAVDPVTGRLAPPNLNELEEQLRAGVADSDVAATPSVPVRVVVPEDGDADAWAVFIDMELGTFLGATDLAPTYDVLQDGSLKAVTSRVLDLRSPAKGADIGIYIRSQAEGPIECARGHSENPTMVVPYDLVAGTGRATVDLSTNGYRSFADKD